MFVETDPDAPSRTVFPSAETLEELGALWWWFTVEMPRLERVRGNDIRGFSLSCHVTGWLLVVRFVREGTPQVVYVRTLDPSACIVTFKRKWIADTHVYFADRYA
jgi:hypothetical protein